MALLAIVLTAFLLALNPIEGSNNGLARTPPMGWLTWARFRCLTDCQRYPDECISENLIKRTADKMVSDGYLEAGYEYVIIDDCWSVKGRDADDKLQADPDRFPGGIKALADYVHELGLKFGIYTDYGEYTCAGYPGSQGHLKLDAQTFAEWGVDYVKMDGCAGDISSMEDDFAEFSVHLNETGRPVVFSCEFTAYFDLYANYSKAVEYCNTWRTGQDIDDRWIDVQAISTWYADNQDFLRQYSGPGGWNDPDMLIIGNFGLSYEQAKAQMTVWSLLAAPLIMSVDLATVKTEFKKILLNENAIRVNQDPLGIQGELVYREEGLMIWTKPLLGAAGDRDLAIGVVSNRTDGFRYAYDLSFGQYLEGDSELYTITDVFEASNPLNGVHPKTDVLTVRVPPTGAVFLLIEAKND